MVLKKFEIL